MRHFRRFDVRAFTLVELLVVVGIIAVLLAILLPAVSRAREQGRQIVCANNERQIATVIFMHVNDNQGKLPIIVNPFPPAPAWEGICMVSPGWLDYESGVLWPYIAPDTATREAVFNCPSDPDPKAYNLALELGLSPTAPTPPRNFSYNLTVELDKLCSNSILSGQFGNTSGLLSVPMSMVRHADHKVLVIEQTSPGGVCGADNVNILSGSLISLLTSRHSGKANIAFFDGHCEPMDPSLFAGQFQTIYCPSYYYVDVCY